MTRTPGGAHTPPAGRLVVWLHTLTGGDAAVSEDLASEAWLTAADKIGGFEGSSSEFAGYLFGIARLLALNDRRRAGRRRTSAADPADLTAMSPTTEPIREIEDMSWIRSRLAGLRRGSGEVVAFLEVVGLDVATTATVLGLSRPRSGSPGTGACGSCARATSRPRAPSSRRSDPQAGNVTTNRQPGSWLATAT